jgi:predicted RNase H-like HicB family nuclease
MVRKTFNMIVEQGTDGYLISSVIELPGCHTQAKTYDELFARTKEAIELYLDEEKGLNLIIDSLVCNKSLSDYVKVTFDYSQRVD